MAKVVFVKTMGSTKLATVVATMMLLWCVDVMADRIVRSSYHMTMMSQLQVEGPCIASLVGQPGAGCVQSEPNVTAFSVYEPSRRLLFSGAADQFLHVNDADTGRPLSKIITAGRVVTKTVFGRGNSVIYFGTDKGKLYALDAYSFATLFTVNADSKINNNIIVVDNRVIFTSAIGTVYSVDGVTGKIDMQLAQPLLRDRLRLAHQSSIFTIADESSNAAMVLVPHNDGYVSVIDVRTGKLRKKIELGLAANHGFPDVVAPMAVLKNRLWVASHDLGLAIIDPVSLRIREQISIGGVLELVTDGDAVYLATTDAIFRVNESGKVEWKTDISAFRSRTPRAAFPFDNFAQGAKRMFFGVPTGMLVDKNRLVVSSSLGSLGIFDKVSGRLLGFLGHSVGFASIEWAGPSSISAISKRGLLMKFGANE